MKKLLLIGFALCCCFSFSFTFSQSPQVVGSFPKEGSQNIIRNAFISVILQLPNGPLDESTVNNQTVKLYPADDPSSEMPSFVTFKYDLRNLTLEPYFLLEKDRAYVFDIQPGVRDTTGADLTPYRFTFWTGERAFQKMITMNRSGDFGEETDQPPVITTAESEAFAGIRTQAPTLPKAARISIKSSVRFQSMTSDLRRKPTVPEGLSPISPPAPQNLVPSFIPSKSYDTDLNSLAEMLLLLDPPAAPEEGGEGQDPELADDPVSALRKENSLAVLDRNGHTPAPLISHPEAVAPERLYLRYSPQTLEDLEARIAAIEALEPPEPAPIVEERATDEASEEALNLEPATVGTVSIVKKTLLKGQKLVLEFDFNEETYVEFKLRTYGGKIVRSESGFVNIGKRKRAVSMQGIPSGTYYAVIAYPNQKITARIVILR